MALFYVFAYILIPALIFFSIQIWGKSQIQSNEMFKEEFSYRYVFAVFYPSIQDGYNSYALGIIPPVIQIILASIGLWYITKPYRKHQKAG